MMRPWGNNRSSLRQLFRTSRVVANDPNHHGEQFYKKMSKDTDFSIVRSKSSMKHATSTLRFIEKKSWKRLRKLMKKLSKETLREIVETIGQMMDQKAEERNVLHLLCAKDPPSDLVQKISELCPWLLLEQDIFGRLPLHVAVACDASISVIDTLLVCHGDAVKMQDDRGRTPLMLACHKPPTDIFKLGVYDKYEMEYLFGPADATYYPGPRIEIVKSLLLAAPRMINHEDDDEYNALEFAVLSEAHEDITEALQNASQREWDRIKKSQALSINRKLSKDSLLSSIITATVKMEDYCESTISISSGEPQIPDVLLTTISSGFSFDSDLSLSDM
eukprot:CAMPEP_0198303018 /NCGR_PEP_ID=MMETSP1449-20131203/56670_1 /TAXON_ID=420275 /ORGANISM="Attheya septentrionalis, Strain CCMP2084" /LENGTH=332 /DNA_ID=CAMNT_0044005499 /DNA_START=153 /DNA_END=1151 /DNA_ORIENTATION=+